MVTTICNKCQQLFDNWSKILDVYNSGGRASKCWYYHYHSIHLVKDSARHGCAVCQLVVASIQKDVLEEKPGSRIRARGQISAEIRSRLNVQDWDCNIVLKFPLEIPGENADETEVDTAAPNALDVEVEDEELQPEGQHHNSDIPTAIVYLNMTLGIDEDPSIQENRISRHTKSDKTLSLAKDWLRTCDVAHSDCSTEGQGYVPTRLLSIQDSMVRLVITADMVMCPRYATLSYCWGNAEFIKLKQENIEDFQRNIPFEKLCKTWKDAIFIAQHLGLEYIWIDALCIIQDSDEDWRSEASTMCDVYLHSRINIAASAAMDGSKGCFVDRDVTPIQRIRVPLTVDDQRRYFDIVCSRAATNGLENSHLSSRAWVVQERFLARRTLHFSHSQVFWECQDKIACETYPTRVSEILFNGDLQHLRRDDTDLLVIWAKLVCYYSSCKLTYYTDKLVAISGVVKYLQKKLGQKYIAGLWAGSLLTQLSWKREYLAKCQSRPTTYQAPSWSWASINTKVLMPPIIAVGPQGEFSTFVTVIEVRTTPAGEDLYGQLSEGVLELQCRYIIECPILIEAEEFCYRRIRFGEKELPCTLVWDAKPEVDKKIYFLPMFDDGEISGIFLESISDFKLGYFRRQGFFNFDRWNTEDFYELVKMPDMKPPDSIYQEYAGVDANNNDLYNIVII